MGFTGVLMIGCGAVLSWAAEATARGRIGINSLVGIRVGYVTASDAAWLAGHRAARVPTHAAAAVFAVLGVFALVFRGSEDVAGFAVIAGSAAVLGLVLWAAVRANRAAYRVVAQERAVPGVPVPHGSKPGQSAPE
ncbi:SdpI family protein [Arthrobacter sp. zg-Y1143]|uniref:SdpI family protein n=1 Tax=Arthrobacter sp. zg-Y1143 TaxID=3049065 RepID=UPI0024C4033A|nr:SdpI family protein [Arthrobacter sp. zg-Y1143]MDK1327393.1 SdpI family protein [Arthrobacter sp. zg-Y1143]